MTAARTVDDVFDPPDREWRRVSNQLVTARRLVMCLTLLPLVGVVVWFALDDRIPQWADVLTLVSMLVVAGFSWWVIGRRVRSWGYVEGPDELLVASGIMFRRLVVVPYGRMQVVDVTAGPIDRAFGISTVQLHTAAATTDAVIPGLPPAEAAALRDRLAARGEQRTAGL